MGLGATPDSEHSRLKLGLRFRLKPTGYPGLVIDLPKLRQHWV